MRKSNLTVGVLVLLSGVAVAGDSHAVNGSGQSLNAGSGISSSIATDSVVLQARDREREQLRVEKHDGPKPMAGKHQPVKTRTQTRKQLLDGSVSQP